MTAEYEIIQTQPYSYLNDARQVVQGYLVHFAITAYDEVHQVMVTSLAKTIVEAAILPIVAQRKALGAPSGK
jgi:hypothetical protein